MNNLENKDSGVASPVKIWSEREETQRGASLGARARSPDASGANLAWAAGLEPDWRGFPEYDSPLAV